MEIDIGWVLYAVLYEDRASWYWCKLTDEQKDNWREMAQDFLDEIGAVIPDPAREEHIADRGRLGAFAEDWDDPAMDVYDAIEDKPDEPAAHDRRSV